MHRAGTPSLASALPSKRCRLAARLPTPTRGLPHGSLPQSLHAGRCGAGSLGYGTVGSLLWAQRFYMTGLLGTPQLPVQYRAAAGAFRWANFQLK